MDAPDGRIVVPPTLPVYLLEDSGDTGELAFDGFEPHLNAECADPLVLDRLDPHGLIYCRVAGVSYRTEALQLSCFSVGSIVFFIPEPTNPKDPSALQVVAKDDKSHPHVGYLPHDLAASIPPELRVRGGAGLVVQTFAKAGQRVGLRVLGTFGRAFVVRRAQPS